MYDRVVNINKMRNCFDIEIPRLKFTRRLLAQRKTVLPLVPLFRRFAAELQLVHYKIDFNNVEDAIANGGSDAVAIVSVLFELGLTDNQVLSSLLANVNSVMNFGEQLVYNY